MQRHLPPLLLLSILSLTFALPAHALDQACQSNNRFCFSLLEQQTAKTAETNTNTNTVFSPFSIWSALAMTSAGAERETLQQMQNVLALPSGTPHQTVATWTADLKKTTTVKMKVANHLWGNRGQPFHPAFLKLTEQQYGASLETLDFSGNPDASRLQINQWVADNTEDKIRDLLTPDLITAATKLVLTNAVYFHGQWALPFEARLTRKDDFTLTSGEVVTPDTMTKLMPASYLENDLLQAVKLPYTGGEMAMILILPRKTGSLNNPACSTSEGFAQVLSKMTTEKRVIIQLPKFEASAKMKLADNLKALGMARAFTDQAQFSLISDSPLAISEVVHQAWIKVSEEGAEAAAATAVVALPGASMPKKEDPPKRFIADHPFLFFIVDTRNNGILFAGRMMNPTK